MLSSRLVVLVVLWLGVACNNQPAPVASAVQDGQRAPVASLVQILSANEAAQEIGLDTVEHFFDQITATDIHIQTKGRWLQAGLPLHELRAKYKLYLATTVQDFSADERAFVQSSMEEVVQMIRNFDEALATMPIKIIKVAGQDYGNSVYYTRQNAIVVPANVLQSPQRERFIDVMIHEYFHIYSRMNPHIRKALYEAIGFHARTITSIPADIQKNLLLNPDGINYNYSIELKSKFDKTQIDAVSLIYAPTTYTPQKPYFMGYLRHQFFEIDAQGAIGKKIDLDQTDFFETVGDNTNYIIHPDEILADNFIILIKEHNDSTAKPRSVWGQKILDSIATILKTSTNIPQ